MMLKPFWLFLYIRKYFHQMIRFINRKRMLPGGSVQGLDQTPAVTSQPVAGSMDSLIQGEIRPFGVTEDPNSQLFSSQYVNMPNLSVVAGTGTTPSMLNGTNNGQPYVNPYQRAVDENIQNYPGSQQAQNIVMESRLASDLITGSPVPTENAYDRNTFTPNVDLQANQPATQEERSQDGNPFDAMTMPYYYSSDLGSRAAMLGRSIGRAGSTQFGQGRAANIMQGISSGVSLAMGLARNIAGAASEERARQRDLQGRRERLINERKRSFINYREGGTSVGPGGFSPGSLTGEYAYPLPKSMEGNANVEVERGEYILRPDVEVPMESLGKRHEKGGAPMSLPDGTHVVSDYRKITPEFVEYLYDNYGIRASVRDTYASVIDKYKSKIGLKDLYEKQEKVYDKLKKNQDVKDSNTSSLNKSVLSKFISENQSEIDALEPDLRRFSDMVYEAQEASKRRDRMDKFYREGGVVDEKKLKEYAKKAGISEDRARSIVYDSYRASLRKMPNGGPTDQQLQWARAVNDLIQNVYGRKLTFSRVDVPGAENILNPGTSATENQGLQHVNETIPTTYGRSNEQALGNLLGVNRWARRYQDLGDQGGVDDFDTLAFQNEYNNRLNMFDALGQSGAVSNSSDAQSFRENYGFWADPATGVIRAGRDDLDSRRPDDLLGQYTLTRSYGGLDVVTPEEKRKLNEAGITNFVDLWGENANKARSILGDESYNRLKQLQDSGLMSNFDFVLDASMPIAEEIDFPTEDVTIQLDPVPVPTPERPAGQAPVEEQAPQRVEEQPADARQRVFSGIPAFPEILRPMSSGIITEGLERHQRAHMEPVTTSADQYINELNRVTSAQMDALGSVPDSQRGAILANLNAIAGTNIGRYIAQNDYQNAARRENARRYNSEQYVTMDDKNIAERQRYEASTLKAMAIDDENRARYLDSLNQEAQQKFNTWATLNTIRSIAPDMQMLPNGQIIYASREDVVPGDWSTGYFDRNDVDSSTRTTRRVKNADGSTTTVTRTNRWGGRVY